MFKIVGWDVFKLVKNCFGEFSFEYLFNLENNIDMGMVYFYILKNCYLKEVCYFIFFEYSMIFVYNGGIGGVLSIFSSDC